jgi:CubicO group peptidase (beta-lactamase class C family)
VFLGVVLCAGPARAESATEKVDRLFATWDTRDSPGCSLGVSREGTTIYERGYGMANLDLGVALTPASVFDAASVSKQFTAMSILLLAQRGQVSLDAEVGQYIPGWGDHGHRITVRHLLTHTSGLYDAFLLQGLAPQRPEPVQEQIVQLLSRALRLEFAPGSRFEYHNGGYTVLADIVARVSGQTFPAFAEANIFKPLGMTHTHFHDDATRIVPNRATGYSRAPNGFGVATRTYTDTLVGNAGLFTTVGDLLRWEQNLESGPVGDRALVAEMQKPAIPTGWSETSEYGWGVEIARHRGLRTIGHSGGDEGRRSYVVRYPDRRLAIALLCNLTDIDPQPLSRSIAEVFLADTFPEPAAETRLAAAPQPAALSPQELQSKVGLYRNLAEESVGRIFLRDGKLMASEDANDGGGFELAPLGANRFVVVGTSALAEFVEPAAGTPQELHVSGVGTKPIVSQLIANPFAPSTAQLRAYEGSYTSADVHGTYTVVARGSGLAVQIPTRNDLPLQPLFTDAFGGSIFGIVKFSRDAQGGVVAFTATGRGVRGLRFDRLR